MLQKNSPVGQLGGINEIGGIVKDGAINMGFILPLGVSFLPLNTVATLLFETTSAIDAGKEATQLIGEIMVRKLENTLEHFKSQGVDITIETEDQRKEILDSFES